VEEAMSKNDDKQPMTGTVLDPKLAPRRLKDSLVPPDTGIYLRIEHGQGASKIYTLSSGGVYVIGRDGADIPLDDGKVSRKHAEIGLYGPDALVLRDLASTNGTMLNGRRVNDRAKLKNWDEIRVGDTVLRFVTVENSIPMS